MNVIREIERINAKELENGIYGGSGKGSWHEKYKNSAWVYVGGLPYELTEGDIICVMSQWGEIEDINLVREKGTNKSQGFAFVKYEDQRSTILAVDNFNGIEILQRMIRVDHVDQYKLPKEVREREEELLDENPDANVNIGPGHAYKSEELLNEYSIASGVNHWAKQKPPSAHDVTAPSSSSSSSSATVVDSEYRRENKDSKKKKHKEHKHHKEHKEHKKDSTKKKKKEHKRRHTRSDDDDSVDLKRHKKDKDKERERDGDKYRERERESRHRRDTETDSSHPQHDQRDAHTSNDASFAPASSSFAPVSSAGGGDSLSWRGRRDPDLADVRRQQQPQHAGSGKGGGGGPGGGGKGGRRDEFSGFGGMNRRR